MSQLVMNSLIAGSIYALVACGFSLIYTTNRFMHFAHGTTIVAAGYLLYQLFQVLGIPFFAASFVSICLAGMLGLSTYYYLYLPLQKRKASNIVLLIASIGVLIFIENLIQLIFGASVKSIGYIKIARGMDLLGAVITPLQLTIILSSIILLGVLSFLMYKTILGRNMRAVADNPELSSIIGIDHVKVSKYSFLIGSYLAGIAGILIGLEQNLEPTMGTSLMIKGFTGAVIGGVGSVPAAALGSYLLGFAENFGIWYLPSGYKDAIAFILLFLFLLFRPSGMFGREKGASHD